VGIDRSGGAQGDGGKELKRDVGTLTPVSSNAQKGKGKEGLPESYEVGVAEKIQKTKRR